MNPIASASESSAALPAQQVVASPGGADAPPEELGAEVARQIAAREKRNFRAFLVETCLQRWGWVFKTESTIIPALALQLGAGPLVLGLFPMLSRGCGYFPQVLFARKVEPLRRKKPLLVALNVLFALLWLGAGLLFLLAPAQAATPSGVSPLLWIFLAIYAASWLCLAGRNVTRSAAVGKLIPADRRGRMFGIGIAGGSLGAALLTWLVIRPVLDSPQKSLSSFGLLFLAVGMGFLLVTLALSFLREPPREEATRAQTLRQFCREAFALLQSDRNYRRAVALQFCFLGAFTLMMFYTGYAASLIASGRFLGFTATFLTVQVLAQFVSSPLLGLLADRCGNRFVLRVLSVVVVLWPVAAVVAGPHVRENPLAYLPVYIFIGMMLPAHFIMVNYYLEIAPEGRQATYVGTANAMMSVAVLLPPVAGTLIGLTSYSAVFCGVAIAMLAAVVLAFSLEEPRHGRRPATVVTQPDIPRPL